MPKRRPTSFIWPGLLLLTAAVGAPPARGQGFVLSGLGPVNRSMGGAAQAAPLDAIGAIHWNPATIGGLPSSEIDFGMELVSTPTRLSSSVGAGALGPGVPPIPLAGSTKADNGWSPLPAFGMIYQPEESAWTYGLGVFTIGGFGVNYPGDSGNPILSAPPPNGLGVGPVFSRLGVLQLAPTAAYQVTPHIAIGFAPTLTLAELVVDPAVFAPPDDANGDGFATYPRGTHSRFHWGAGFQAGVYYTGERGWNLGGSIKSPQWFETFRFNSADELGRPRSLRFRFDYPMILSAGIAYTGFERFVLATDVRYLDFKNAPGLGTAAFDRAGAVTGFGWDSVFAVAAGAQYQWTDSLSVRLGYSFSQNPIPDAVSFFNIASSSITQHIVYTGFSYNVTHAWKISAAYVHAFKNSITGPFVTPFGALPETSVTSELSVDSLVAGVSVQF